MSPCLYSGAIQGLQEGDGASLHEARGQSAKRGYFPQFMIIANITILTPHTDIWMKYVHPQSDSPQPHCHQVNHHHIDENPPKVCTKVQEDVCKERVEKKCWPAKCDYSVSFNVFLFCRDNFFVV